MKLKSGVISLASVVATVGALPAWGQDATQTAQVVPQTAATDPNAVPGSSTAAPATEQITVTGESLGDRKLNTVNPTGSRLGLTSRETPAAIDMISSTTMELRGYTQVQDAVDSLPGVTSGGSPGDPTGFSMRGFTGDQITVLRNGTYIGPSDMVSRPQNSFNLDDVQVLKGPASVLYGQGAVGGVINVLTKDPEFGPTTFNSQLTYGSFNTLNFGAGFNTQASDDLALRFDISRTSSGGYVHNDDPDNLNATFAALWKIRSDLTARFGLDYIKDDLPSYYGTPLVTPAFAGGNAMTGLLRSSDGSVIDERTRYNNYNTSDSEHKSTQITPTVLLTWKPTDDITVTNNSYYYYAERKWQNAETYTFLGPNNGQTDAAGNAIPANQIGRDRFYVFHQQHMYGDVLDGSYASRLFGLDNKVTVGTDINTIHFLRARGFPDAQYADYVDPLQPNQGSFGTFPGDYPQRLAPTQIDNYAGFVEDALDILPNLKLVTGARYELERLNRENFNANGSFNTGQSFTRIFHPFNYRVGAVYDILPNVTMYAQYTTAEDPVGSNIFLVNSGQNLKLSSSREEEVGLKSSFDQGKGDVTLSLYDIHRENILSQTAEDTVSNIGGQKSRGVELSTDFRPLPQWNISANTAYTFATYETFIDTSTGLNDSGNRPPNVPAWTANLWTNYTDVADLPLDLGGGLRYISARAGNNANSLKLDGYTLANIYATYHITRSIDATFRIDNLFDKAYVAWADINYPSEVILGAPRSYAFSIVTHF